MSTVTDQKSNGSASSLGQQSTALEEKLCAREVRRRLWHITPGFLPLILWPIPHEDPISPTLKYIVMGIAAAIGIRIFVQFQQIRRSDQESRAGAVLGYSLAVLGTVLAFPAHLELAFTVLAILAFGDGCATLGGLLFGGRALPWNREKTIAGTVSFMLAGSVMGAVIYWGEANPTMPFWGALQISALAAFFAAIAESLPTKLDDNIRVGVAAAIFVPLGQRLVFGF